MLKIRHIKNVGLGIASLGIASGPGACASHASANSSSADDTQGPQAQTQAEQPVAPGAGVLTMNGFSMSYASSSGGDEFIRTGESLTLSAPFDELSEYACPGECSGPGMVTQDQVQVTAAITYYDTSGAVASTHTETLTWGSNGIGTSRAFVVPAAVRYLAVAFSVTNTSIPQTLGLGYFSNNRFAVFGAFLPSKEVIFDNNSAGQLRQRVIEGGPLAAGANVTLSYSDWRANGIVNSGSLNTVIGHGTTDSRFGEQTNAILGTLTYNIQADYSVDGGDTWTTTTLNADVAPDSLQDTYNRTAYEATIALPGGATDFQVAFHIQAILVANPQYDQYVDNWAQAPNGSTYQLGQSYVLADTWDNAESDLGNYDFVVTATGN